MDGIALRASRLDTARSKRYSIRFEGMPSDIGFVLEQLKHCVQRCQVGADLGYLVLGVNQIAESIRDAYLTP